MTTYFTADWHLGHARIIELANRPFTSVDQMNRVIIRNVNSIVNPEDTLIVLGDVVLGTYAANVRLLTQIRCGRTILIPGNHDRWSLAYKGNDTRRAEALTGLFDLGLYPQADREPSVWESKIGDYPVVLSHYPYTGDGQGADRVPHLRPRDTGLPLIHGHVHNLWRQRGRMLNVGVDMWGFAPVSEHQVLDWLQSLGTDE